VKKLVFILVIVVFMFSTVGKVGGKIGKSEERQLRKFIIISSQDLVENVGLKKFVTHKQRNFEVVIADISDIWTQFSGEDKAENIRNYIIAEADSELIPPYVLLIGNSYNENEANNFDSGGDIPLKYFYPDSDKHEIDDAIPTDLYYSITPQYGWDKDGDQYYGEKDDDIIIGGAVTINAVVGRIPFSDSEIVSDYFLKLLSAEQEYEKKVELKSVIATPFASIDESGKAFDMAIFGEMVKDRLGLFTHIETLYEKEGDTQSLYECTLPLNKENFSQLWGADIAFICAHGGNQRIVWKDSDGDGKVQDSEVKSVEFFTESSIAKQPPTFFLYTYGCNTALENPIWDYLHPQTYNLIRKRLLLNSIGLSRITETGPATHFLTFYSQLGDHNSLGDSNIFALKDIFKDKDFLHFPLRNIYCISYVGDPSAMMFDSCNPPVLDLPWDDTIVSETPLIFSWHDCYVDDNRGYMFQLSTDSEMKEMVEETYTKETSISFADIQNNTKYYWRVGKVTDFGVIWTEIRTFIYPQPLWLDVNIVATDNTLIISGKTNGKTLTVNNEIVLVNTNGTFQKIIILLLKSDYFYIRTSDQFGIAKEKVVHAEYKKIELQIGSQDMYVNGQKKKMDVVPVIIENRTFVPIRWISESLGAQVGWDGVERKVTVSLKDIEILLWIGKHISQVNNTDIPIDSMNIKVVPIILNSRTLVPLRFISENLECKVDWNSETRTITISHFSFSIFP